MILIVVCVLAYYFPWFRSLLLGENDGLVSLNPPYSVPLLGTLQVTCKFLGIDMSQLQTRRLHNDN
jgi:hypothetical protein